MTLHHNATAGTPGAFTFELMQCPLPKLGAAYDITPGLFGPDIIAIIVPYSWNDGTTTNFAHCPKFFTPISNMAALTCEQFP